METATKEQFLQEIERIEGLPEAERWHEIKTLLLAVNPELKPLDDHFVAQLEDDRNEQDNDFGASKERSLRMLIDVPRYLYDALIIADPEFEQQVKNKEGSKQLWRKMAKVFPEYKIARKV